ncbi:MAG: PD-(D/E)XK nuclease family protein [Phycisphaerae bacterium]|jgi:ATP-dependent helicase/nuclease subunit B
MTARFVIGRAGSGKTHHCLESIREQLRQDPIDGPRLILLVPEQASLQMERAILGAGRGARAEPQRASAHRAEVLSFRRLAFRVLETVGAPPLQALTEPARAMVVRHLFIKHAGKLRYYQRVARSGATAGRLSGFVGQFSATVAELIEEAVDPDDLMPGGIGDGASRPQTAQRGSARVSPERTGGLEQQVAADDDPMRAAKLHDLRLIYQAYIDYLGTSRLDPSQYLQVARDSLDQCSWLAGAFLWVDGFASLSRQEMLTLLAVTSRCQHVDITAMADPAAVGRTAARGRTDPATARLFLRTAVTCEDLRDGLIRSGIEVQDPLVLDEVPPPRFRDSVELAGLERHLFTARAVSADGLRDPPRTIELVELPSRRIEVDYAVSRVIAWLQEPDPGFRCRDIAVIARDLEPYHDLLSEALNARGIPYFIDRRRPLSHHPLVEFLRAAVSIVTERLSTSSVRLALKTGLLSLSDESADELENHLIAHGIGGADAWRGDAFTAPAKTLSGPDREPTTHETDALERINRSRLAFLGQIDAWLAFADSGSAHHGRAWVRGIFDLIRHVGIAKTLERWAADAEEQGDLDLAEEHRQVWREAMSFLDDLAFAFAGKPLTIAELRDVLDAGLPTLTLGLAPSKVDQVLVGAIERSRHPDIRAAVVLGFNDGAFPLRPAEDSILNDDDRTSLQASGVRVRAGSRQRALDEALLAYVALTRASDRAVVTYAAADNAGKLLRPSMYVRAIQAACPGLTPAAVTDPIRSRQMWDLLSASDRSARLALEFSTRPPLARDAAAPRRAWNELYFCTRAELESDEVARFALSSLQAPDAESLSPKVVERWCGGVLRTSISELESFAACPFQHFARYVLRLQERAQSELQPVDVGQVHHAILEEFVRALATRGQGFEQVGERELTARLEESCTQVATRLPPEGCSSDARSAYLLRRSAARLARMVRAQRRRAAAGSSRPRAVELPFGFDEPDSLPALELNTPSGRRVHLRGYIDRVDLAELGDELLGIVVDYKRTGEKRLDLSSAYHGISLQLLAYLLALAEVGETLAGRPIRPIGALFVGLGTQYVTLDHPDQISERDAILEGTRRPRGLLLADDVSVLDKAADPGWSDHYAVYRKKDGSLGQIDHSDAADAASFAAMLEHTRTKLGQLADGVLDGLVAVNPYRMGAFSPCAWCTMQSVCRFESGLSTVRYLQKLKRSELLQRLKDGES